MPDKILEYNKSAGFGICVSIIIPTFIYWPERSANRSRLTRAVEKAKNALTGRCSRQIASQLDDAMDQLTENIDFTKNSNGTGLFVAENFAEIVHFNFPVKEKIMIGNFFSCREIMAQSFYSHPYFVLLLSENVVQLFTLLGNQAKEISDSEFPMNKSDKYDYNKPSHSSSYMGRSVVAEFEKDSSEMEKLRTREFFREADKKLRPRISESTPLIVIGTELNLAMFLNITDHIREIAGTIEGNYSHLPHIEWSTLAWDSFRSHMDDSKTATLAEFEEKIGAKQGIFGLEHVRRAISVGNCRSLLIEENFSQTTADSFEPDVTEEILYDLIQHGGNVIFFLDGELNQYGKIALIKRYSE